MALRKRLAMELRTALLVVGLAAFGGALAQGGPASRSAPLQAGVAQPGASTEWVDMRVQASDLAISPDGDVYALDAAGQLWKRPNGQASPGSGGWVTQPGQYRRIRATLDRTIWAIDSDNILYRLRNSVWSRFLGSVLDVAAAPDGRALVLTTAGQLLNPDSGQPFLPAPPESPARIESLLVDVHGLPWIQREDRSVLRFNGTAWQVAAAPSQQLASVATGLDGAALGVAADGRMLSFSPLDNTWQAYSAADVRTVPPMRHVAIGPNGLPWGISRAGTVMAERSLSKTPPPVAQSPAVFTRLLTWRIVGGASNRVSVGQDGTVFSTAPDGRLWQRKRGNEWTNVPFRDGIRAIAASIEGRGWVLNDKGEVIQIDRGSQSPPLPSPGQIRLIAVGPRGILWVVLINNQVSSWNPVARQWKPEYQLPDAPRSFSVGMRDEPWYIDSKGVVVTRRTSGNTLAWESIEGIKAVSLAAGPEGTVYATSDDEGIYWLDPREMRWKPASGKAVQVSVGPRGAPWAITAKNELLASGSFLEDQQARESAQSQARAATPGTQTAGTQTTGTQTAGTQTTGSGGTQIVQTSPGTTITVAPPRAATTKPLSFDTIAGDARFVDISIGTRGHIFAISTDGALMCFNNIASNFVLASSGINARVAVAPDGLPWILDNNGRISRFDRPRAAWRTVPNFTGVDISVGPDGQLWAAGGGGGVFRYIPSTDSFELEPVQSSDVTFRPRRIAGANARVHWVVTEQSQLVRCEKNTCRVELIGATDVSVAPDNTLFVTDLVGSILRYDPKTRSFNKQNGQGSVIAAGPGGLPWVVTAAGKVSSSGAIAAGTKTINTPDCATAFATAPVPAAPTPSVVLVAADDTATLSPGASLNLLANDTFAGRAANTSDVTVSLETPSSLLALNGGSLFVASNATAGAVINGRYKVCPRNVVGNCVSANFAITVAGTTVAPTAVTAIAGNGNATVSFAAPAGFAGVTISNYTVTASPGSVTVTGASSPITVSGLTNDTAYTFTVTARYSNGATRTSDPSAPVTPSAVVSTPAAPTVGVATAGNAQASISFTAPASNGGSPITAYTVSSSPGGISASGAGSPITVTGLANGTSYTFTVRAANAIGLGAPSQPSNSVTPGLVTAPGAPVIGTATAANAQVSVAFTPPASNGGSAITGYRVTSSPGGIVATGAASPIVVTGLTNGTAYTFTVAAVNAIGTSLASGASNSATPTSSTVPGAPAIGAATAGNAQASVTFTPPGSNGGSAITGYRVTSSPGGVVATGAASPIVVTGLTNGTAYTFTVAAVNAVGIGPVSGASNSATPTAVTVPGAPVGVSASVSAPGALGVVFSAPASNGGSAITGYTVTSSPGGLTASGPASPIVVPGLSTGTPYSFTVTATNAVGTGPASAASPAVNAVNLPGAPQGLGGGVAAGPTINLSWTAPASNGGAPIAQYVVQCMPMGLNPTVSGTTASTSISLVHDGMTTLIFSGETYNCLVGAQNTVFPGMPGPPASAGPFIPP